MTPNEDFALQVQGLARRFENGAGVSDVNLSVRAGETVGFIGVNGAGKSTTLRCILGLLHPDQGAISLFGAPADAANRARTGFLPEERGLSPKDRARDVIAFNGRLKGLDKAFAYRRADELLERIGLGARKSARVHELSKGNAQRVQILCALAHKPDLLIMDEPLSGLDPVAQAEVLSLFAEFRGQGGAILFSTHSMAAAQNLCDKVVILSGGRTAFEGPLAEAAAHAPHGAVIVTDDPQRLHAACERVGAIASPMAAALGEASRWRVVLPAHVPHPALLRALADTQTPLFAFEPIKQDLEGAFWALAAPPAPAQEPVPAPRGADRVAA
jgi:ABC-2 type transport system ATP-binding protein